MLTVILLFSQQNEGRAKHLADRLRQCGFSPELRALSLPLPSDYLAIIALDEHHFPESVRRALPHDVINAYDEDYDSVIKQLVRRLAKRSSTQPETGASRRAMQLPDEDTGQVETTRGIKPSEPAPKPLPTAPLPSEPVRAIEEPPQGAVAEPKPIAEARFTAFLPSQAAVQRWHSLLVYAHTPEMLDHIRTDAKRFAPELGDALREVRDAQATALERGTSLTFTPQAENVTFNPESITIKWLEDVHRLEFRFRAEAALANLAANVTITVSADPIIIAQVRGGILFNPPESAYAPSPFENEPITAAPYRAEEIFISYSRRDSDVVTACRNAYRALGYTVLLDVDNLRSGEKWNEQLKHMIERASIFQLFWSENSANSEFCRQEWQHALQLARARHSDGTGYIRPVYWREPMVPPPQELSHLHFAYVHLPRLKRRTD
jgi:hypothetical protein